MKKLLLILLCFPMIGFGQDDDIITLQNEVNDINYRMEKYHKQFYKGVTISAIGVGSTIMIGSAAITGGVGLVNPFFYIASSSLILLGQIITLDSHKWFKNNTKRDKKNTIEYLEFEKRTKQLDDLWKRGEITKSDLKEERRKNRDAKINFKKLKQEINNKLRL